MIVSAPSSGADATFVVGVNDDTFDAATHKVVSNASCTTNCFVPMIKVLDDAFGVEQGPDDHDPRLHRRPEAGRRPPQRPAPGPGRGHQHHPVVAPARPGPPASCSSRCRASSTAQSLRVPVPDGSITDFIGVLSREVTVDEVNEAFTAAAESGPLAKVLEYSTEPLVSSRHRRLAGVVHVRLPAHHGDRQPGQGARLVRQRVGLLEPPRRPRRRSSAPPTRPDVTAASRRSRTCRPSTGKRVLLRADFNVPLADGADHRRPAHPRRAADASSGCRSTGADVMACTHLGRPKGEPDPKYSVEPVRARLAELAPGRRAAREPALRPGRGGATTRRSWRSSSTGSTPT